MPCDTYVQKGQTTAQRKEQIKKSLESLEKALAIGQVGVKVGPQGAIAFAGWNDRVGITDVCAFRKLSAAGSITLRQAVARAEALAGRKVDLKQVAAGTHFHEGSGWHKGH